MGMFKQAVLAGIRKHAEEEGPRADHSDLKKILAAGTGGLLGSVAGLGSFITHEPTRLLVSHFAPAVAAGLLNHSAGASGPEAMLSGLGALVGNAGYGTRGAILGGMAGAGVGPAIDTLSGR